MSERLDERLRRAARTYRRLGNHTAEGMFLEAADTICELQAENAKLREWCSDFWKWADPPFALKSGTFDEYMALGERAVELGVIK